MQQRIEQTTPGGSPGSLDSLPMCQSPFPRDRMTENGDPEGTRSSVPCPLLASSELLGVSVGQGRRGRGTLPTGSSLISVCLSEIVYLIHTKSRHSLQPVSFQTGHGDHSDMVGKGGRDRPGAKAFVSHVMTEKQNQTKTPQMS